MSSSPVAPNAIAELLDESGQLKKSFGAVSIDTLRLALSQLVDGLERLGELGEWIERADDWRREIAPRRRWERTMYGHAGVLESSPLQDLSDGDAKGIGDVRWGTMGHPVSQMRRKEVEAAIRDSFDAFDRYRRLAQALVNDSTQLLAGQRVQAECDKEHGPDPADVSPPTSKRRGPGPR